LEKPVKIGNHHGHILKDCLQDHPSQELVVTMINRPHNWGYSLSNWPFPWVTNHLQVLQVGELRFPTFFIKLSGTNQNFPLKSFSCLKKTASFLGPQGFPVEKRNFPGPAFQGPVCKLTS